MVGSVIGLAGDERQRHQVQNLTKRYDGVVKGISFDVAR
jgi:hypothetical protein